MANCYTFVPMLNEYLKTGMVEHDLAIKTQKLYWELSAPLRRFFKGFYVSFDAEGIPTGKHLNGSAVERYRSWRLNTLNKRGSKPSPVTVQKELIVAGNAIKYQIRDKYSDMPNPFEGRTILKRHQKAIRPRAVVLEREKEKNLLIACGQPLRDIVLFILETGLRKGEILTLEWNMIKGDVIDFEPGQHKSGNYAASALSREALNILSRQPKCCARVFTKNGQPYTHSMLRKAWERARMQTGLPELHLHDLRRTCGYRLREKGFALDAIQAQLRHSDRRTTEKVYAPPGIELARSLFL